MVPPDILNLPDMHGGGGSVIGIPGLPGLPGGSNLEEGNCNEGGIIQLICSATGVPEPTVQWRREGGKDIILRSDTREKQSKY